jgi:hypothetical protein
MNKAQHVYQVGRITNNNTPQQPSASQVLWQGSGMPTVALIKNRYL